MDFALDVDRGEVIGDGGDSETDHTVSFILQSIAVEIDLHRESKGTDHNIGYSALFHIVCGEEFLFDDAFVGFAEVLDSHHDWNGLWVVGWLVGWWLVGCQMAPIDVHLLKMQSKLRKSRVLSRKHMV